jgi:hypothetical protein
VKRLFVVFCMMVLLTTPTSVNAGQRSLSSVGGAVSTSTWAVVAVGQNQNITNTPYQLTWSVSNGVAYNFFYFQNSGTVDLNSLSADIVLTRVGGNGPANEVILEWCLNGVWDSISNTCSGIIVLITRSTDAGFSLNSIVLPVGSQLDIRARTAVSGRNNFAVQINTKAARADVRAGITDNL